MATIDLKAQRALIAAKRRELDDWERALNTVERQAESIGPRITAAPPAELGESGLTNAARLAAPMFGDQEWSVPDLEKLLTEHNVQLPRNDPRSRLAMIVKQMVDEKLIERTAEGSGRIPHKYRWRK